MRVPRDIVNGRFDTIERNLRFLGGYKGYSEMEFTSSYKDVQAAKFSLLEIVEACIDVANHIISAEGYPRAELYSLMFKTLGREEVLDKCLASKLGFSNSVSLSFTPSFLVFGAVMKEGMSIFLCVIAIHLGSFRL